MYCVNCGKTLDEDDLSYGACRKCGTYIESEQ
jgi:hypothetical protein